LTAILDDFDGFQHQIIAFSLENDRFEGRSALQIDQNLPHFRVFL
jgi:hypothetical protein